MEKCSITHLDLTPCKHSSGQMHVDNGLKQTSGVTMKRVRGFFLQVIPARRMRVARRQSLQYRWMTSLGENPFSTVRSRGMSPKHSWATSSQELNTW